MILYQNFENAEYRFNTLSVTDDYIIDERELIKEWTNKAKHYEQRGNTTTISI